ncbi:hypothetical protein AT395_16740 [Pandoraea apista]|nr:hypothetical protein AT395_16740 [Pandoraea apista]
MLIKKLKDHCDLIDFSLNPKLGGERSFLWRILVMFIMAPAPVFVLLSRRTGLVWFEFFLRISPFYFLWCLWLRVRYRPEFVIFNHHASFCYQAAFGCKKILIWHDVPSLKFDATRARGKQKRCSAALERCFIRSTFGNVTFSFDDQRMLLRLHRRNSYVIPVVPNQIRVRSGAVNDRSALLIGNWTRIENVEGATAFLRAYLDAKVSGANTDHSMRFHIAGHGSVEYVSHLKGSMPDLRELDIQVTGRYEDICQFDEGVMLAPLLRGAGIKLKTIEAWSRNIPVVGTRQAFTGLPRSIWSRGGVLLETPADIARLCLAPDALKQACQQLSPLTAFQLYQDAIERSAKTSAPVSP